MPHRTGAIISARVKSSHHNLSKAQAVATMRATRALAGRRTHPDLPLFCHSVRRTIRGRPGKCPPGRRRSNSHRVNVMSRRRCSKLRRHSSLSSVNNVSSDRHPPRLVRRANGNVAAANRSIKSRYDILFLAIVRCRRWTLSPRDDLYVRRIRRPSQRRSRQFGLGGKRLRLTYRPHSRGGPSPPQGSHYFDPRRRLRIARAGAKRGGACGVMLYAVDA